MARRDRWIAVEDQLPDADIEVLGIAAGEFYFVAWYCQAEGWVDAFAGPLNFHFTHWMHLPAAPGEGEGAG